MFVRVTFIVCALSLLVFQESYGQKIDTVSDGKTSIAVYDFEALNSRFNVKNDTAYVFNFWATWCAPCVKELPNFINLNNAFPDQPVQVVLVSMDFRSKISDQLLPFLQKNKIDKEVLVLSQPNPNSWIDRISPDWSGALPATLMIRKNKKQFFEREFTEEELHNALKEFIN